MWVHETRLMQDMNFGNVYKYWQSQLRDWLKPVWIIFSWTVLWPHLGLQIPHTDLGVSKQKSKRAVLWVGTCPFSGFCISSCLSSFLKGKMTILILSVVLSFWFSVEGLGSLLFSIMLWKVSSWLEMKSNKERKWSEVSFLWGFLLGGKCQKEMWKLYPREWFSQEETQLTPLFP